MEILPIISYILLALAVFCILFLLKALKKKDKAIKDLQDQLTEEKKKRTFPFLVFEIDKEALEAYLCNESYCYAKNIVIEDLNFTHDMGFKKKLNLRFDEVNMIKPNQKVKLHFRVFDREYDLTTGGSRSLLLQLTNEDFTMKVHYENLEGMKYFSTITFENGEFVLKDAKEADEPNGNQETLSKTDIS